MCNNFLFENGTIYEIMSKNMVESVEPQMTLHDVYELHAGQARLHARTHTNMLYALPFLLPFLTAFCQ
jgi:hypothetical protein